MNQPKQPPMLRKSYTLYNPRKRNPSSNAVSFLRKKLLDIESASMNSSGEKPQLFRYNSSNSCNSVIRVFKQDLSSNKWQEESKLGEHSEIFKQHSKKKMSNM